MTYFGCLSLLGTAAALAFSLTPAGLLCQQPTATPADSCTLAEPPVTANRPNLFSAQQEQWLGESMAGAQEPNYTLLPEKASPELTRIGQKLLAQLPPTPIPYHFRVYDTATEDLNGFSLAGGYIYASRKLLLDAKSEDEVAGMLAHEIGHIYTHQIATSVTRELTRLMGVSSLGDRDDVLDKYQRLMNAQWKDAAALDEKDQEKDELRADAVGLYAMVRAGYAPQAFATNLERIAASKGRNGNVLTDILGGTSEVGVRVRTARGLVNSAPEACRHRESSSSTTFTAFQDELRTHPINPLDDPTPGLTSIALDQPVRPGLNWLRFSPDGKYLLAQNETYVFVMQASPLKMLFKIYAPLAGRASFTPDAKHVVFHYQSLRVENWDVETQKLAAAHEIFEYRGCWQSELSPDGKYLACVYQDRDNWPLSLELFDVATGKVLLNKGSFFDPDRRAQTYSLESRLDWDPETLAIAFSPDAQYMVVAASSNNFALNLTTMKPVKMSLSLGGLLQGRLAFTAANELLYDCDAGQRGIFHTDQSNVCLAEFPSGRQTHKFAEGWESLWPVTKGSMLVAGSIFDSIPHLVDVNAGKPSSLLRYAASDVYGTLEASESGKGGITLGDIGSPKMESLDFPTAELPYVRTARFSPDGQYLALSNESRGALWNLTTNKQIVLTRAFRGAWFDGGGDVYLQLTQSQAKPGQNFRFNVKTGSAAETGKYDREVRQMLDVSMERVIYDVDHSLTQNVGLEVHDAKTGAALWKRRFAKDAPHVVQEEPGTLVMSWGMEKETAWDEIAHAHPVTASDEVKEKHQGLLTEVFNSQTGAVQSQLISPEGSKVRWASNSRLEESGQSDDRRSRAYGKLIAVRGNQNNTVVYDAENGARLAAFWGQAIAGSARLGLIAATNRDQDLVVYDTATGKERLHATVDDRVAAAHFVEDTKQLLVLTVSQRLYTFDLGAASLQAAK